MSDRPSPSARVARAAALVCSVALASVVIVNAQFGCDAPASAEPRPAASTPSKPGSEARPTAAPAQAQPEPEPEAAVEAKAELASDDPPEPAPEPPKRLFMPASKSAGDFDSLPLAPPSNAAPQAQQAQQAPQP
jgi:translation initiation factor IF-2